MEDKIPQNIQPGQDSPSGSGHKRMQDDSTSVMKHAVSEFISARIELVAIEAKEAAEFTVRKVVMALALALCAFFIWTLVMAGLTGLLAGWAEEQFSNTLPNVSGWVIVLFGLALLHAIAAVTFVILLKKQPTTPLFELSRQEIENDKAWVKSNK